jgi:hypothetical protein
MAGNIPKCIRDEVIQEIRIKLWGFLIIYCKEHKIRSNKDRLDNNELAKNIVKYIGNALRNAQHTVKTRRYKYNFFPIDAVPNEDLAVGPLQYIGHELAETKDTLNKLMACLDDEEKFIVNYMLFTNNIEDNNDKLMRQLGYTGKGSVKYILNKIQQKMLAYAKENNIVVEL